MPSAAQAEASRANGTKSTGPVSAQGKSRSAQNSLRHGFASSKTFILPGETCEEYESLLESLAGELQPAGEIEENLVEELVIAKWRLNRIRRNQEQLLADGDFLAALEDPEKDRKLRLLIRYEKDFERQYRAAYKLLLDHRARLAGQAELHHKAQSLQFQQMMESYITGPVPGENASRNEPGSPQAPAPGVQAAARPGVLGLFRRR